MAQGVKGRVKRVCVRTDSGYWQIQGLWSDPLPSPDLIPTEQGPYVKARETKVAVYYTRQEAEK